MTNTKQNIKHLQARQKGLSIIEIVLAIAIFSLAFISILYVFQMNNKLLAVNKTRIASMAIADRYLEFAKALKYSDLGVQGSDPSGILQANDSANYAGVSFAVNQSVRWVDDDKDGLSGADTDGNTHDYKQYKVTISWQLAGKPYSYSRVTNIYAPF